MNPRLLWISILLSHGCAAETRTAEPARSTASVAPARSAEAPAAADEPAKPAEQLAQADLLYSNQLGAGLRDDRYVDRQVAALREAIALYERFIERAGDEPQFREAVRRSRERIEDARATIEFLLAK